jgi:putative intracellular protease/amidase
MPEPKKIGFIFIHRFADWEYGFLAAGSEDWIGIRAFSLAPNGKPVTGTSGFRLMPDRALDEEANADLDAVAVIGSDEWTADSPPDVSALLRGVSARGGTLGGICGGTLALARSGLLDGRKHTSNGREWILGHAPGYAGSEFYQDVPRAVADGPIVTAPGSAPVTFARAFLETLYSDRKGQLAEMGETYAREHAVRN